MTKEKIKSVSYLKEGNSMHVNILVENENGYTSMVSRVLNSRSEKIEYNNCFYKFAPTSRCSNADKKQVIGFGTITRVSCKAKKTASKRLIF